MNPESNSEFPSGTDDQALIFFLWNTEYVTVIQMVRKSSVVVRNLLK